MNKDFLGVPVAIFVLALLVAIFTAIPQLFLFQLTNNKLDKIDTQIYQLSNAQDILLDKNLATASATPSASPKATVIPRRNVGSQSGEVQ